MIAHYEFDNANIDGDKEAVIVPNVPTLVNKLSANETNNIRNKINELVDATNPLTPIQFLELRLKFKGEGNTLDTLQVGDIVHGFADADTIWTNARYLGGDINDRDNYENIATGITQTSFPRLTIATSTFTISGTATHAFVNGQIWYLNDANLAAEPNTITQSGTTVTFKTIRPIGNLIVIFHQ